MKGRRFAAALAALALLAGLLSGCGRSKRYETTYLDLFDTVTTITGYAESFTAFRETAQSIHDELMEYHQLFDIYHEYPGMNNLKTVNDRAGSGPVAVDRRILELLQFGKELERETGGVVNVAMGSVLALWHQARETALADPDHGALPDAAALEMAAAHCDFDCVVLDEAAGTVCLTDPQLRLDVGAVAKGYAVEQVCRSVPDGYLVNVGGNVRTCGSKPDGAAWSVGLQSPEGGYLHTVSAGGTTSVVTSGDYQRYFTVDGMRYHHIIDPATGMPGEKWRAVSVICADSGVADALSTALFLLDREKGQELLDRFDAEALWLDRSGGEFFSPGIAALLQTQEVGP